VQIAIVLNLKDYPFITKIAQSTIQKLVLHVPKLRQRKISMRDFLTVAIVVILAFTMSSLGFTKSKSAIQDIPQREDGSICGSLIFGLEVVGTYRL